MDFNRYTYARGNPMKYNDPSGHCIWDLCLVEGIGLVELLMAAGGTAGYYAYVNSPAGQAAIEHAGQALDNLNASQAAQESVPLPAPTKPQITGTPLNKDDTTTIQATTPLGNSVTAPLLSDPLPTQQKGSNIVFSANFNTGTLQHEWKHASDFGLSGNWNKANGELFQKTLENFIDNAPEKISGTFRGTVQVTHYYDRASRLWVAVDTAGNYIASWKLSGAQERNLLQNGNVQ